MWTKPYYGLTHCGELSNRYRASVQEYDGFCIAYLWTKGCGFSPQEKQFSNVSEAKTYCEQWINHATT